MKKDMNQIIKRLEREGLIVDKITTNAGHLRLVLASGACYVSAKTPSDYRGLRNLEADVRRLNRQTVIARH
jgi:hypothetical protein